MLSARDILLLILCTSLSDASPLAQRYGNTTFSLTASSSTTIDHASAYMPAAAESTSMSSSSTGKDALTSIPGAGETPPSYGLGILTSPAATTPPATASLHFTFVGQKTTSQSAPRYTPASLLSSSIEVASASTYRTVLYSNSSTVSRSMSTTMVTMYTTVMPNGYTSSSHRSATTVTSFTTIYPSHATTETLTQSPKSTDSSISAPYYSPPSMSSSTSTGRTSSSIATNDSPHHTTGTSTASQSTTSKNSTTTFQETSSVHAQSTAGIRTTEAKPSSVASETSLSAFAYPLPNSPSSTEATATATVGPFETTAPAYIPAFSSAESSSSSMPQQTSLPEIVTQYTFSPSTTDSAFSSSTSSILGGITIVPVNPYSNAITVTVTVTDAGKVTTATVAKETVTVTIST